MKVTFIITGLLFVVECNLLAPGDVPGRVEAEPGQVGVQAVDPDVEDVEVRLAGVVDEVGHVAEQSRVHGVGVVVPEVEVEVEEIRLAFGVWND